MKVRVTDLAQGHYDDAEVALMDEQCALINHSDESVVTYVRAGDGNWLDMEGNTYAIAERG
jgi:hypothetical protein